MHSRRRLLQAESSCETHAPTVEVMARRKEVESHMYSKERELQEAKEKIGASDTDTALLRCLGLLNTAALARCSIQAVSSWLPHSYRQAQCYQNIANLPKWRVELLGWGSGESLCITSQYGHRNLFPNFLNDWRCQTQTDDVRCSVLEAVTIICGS
ncbi:hypothetical protein K437DRAFT_152416 [Tilletiaria anomala UBC 951]|uniref:Uncharacterized protein n=1 Tax=Tilletiaria anomala (strain ATCC 24038 / CBS 436.72 / UBC 951) TaxID=1037660 RepID=A0A066VT30_TILAU|nr:uncharacterized protein K437DRAFT_152416 [Tilletiaria anomala UBC 951]KDN43423.1 hypothetical protein K437DRAFT_152416 [Tilletiaria anomala UBC 951]